MTISVYLERLLTESLPAASVAERAELLPTLTQLAQAPARVTPAEFDRFLEQLVQAGQRQILQENLPVVVQDSIAEQIAWQQQKVAQVAETPRYVPVGGYFNQTVSAIAVAQMAAAALGTPSQPSESPPDDRLATFFATDYRIGREQLLTDLPAAILKALGARALLVLRDILNSLAANDPSRRWQRSFTYRVLNRALQLVYWWLQRQSPAPQSPLRQQLQRLGRALLLLGAIAASRLPRAIYRPGSWVCSWPAYWLGCWELGAGCDRASTATRNFEF
ncbi:MAG: hypothetical protein HC838_03890 [Spirulinaceae cyanobacterium RM2_2_10]|nr:hypothetical protein [Spirulinaceae cyanobacterium RM2_2_10]